jgi:hypothetical protein
LSITVHVDERSHVVWCSRQVIRDSLGLDSLECFCSRIGFGARVAEQRRCPLVAPVGVHVDPCVTGKRKQRKKAKLIPSTNLDSFRS